MLQILCFCHFLPARFNVEPIDKLLMDDLQTSIFTTRKEDIETEGRVQYKRYLPNCLPLVIECWYVFAIMQDFCQSKGFFIVFSKILAIIFAILVSKMAKILNSGQ